MEHLPENLEKPSLKDLILKEIETGRVAVKPKWRFTAAAIFSALGLSLGFSVTLFALTLIHFSLRQAGVFALPGFGEAGVREFFFEVPWFPLVLIGVAACVLEVWLLRYAFFYRRPMLYSLIAVAAFFLLGTVVISAARVHENVYSVVEMDNVPFVRPLYHSVIDPEREGLERGMVAELETNGFLLRGHNGELVNVIVTSQTRISPPFAVRVGDMVIVFGQNKNGEITAVGIKKLPPGFTVEIRP